MTFNIEKGGCQYKNTENKKQQQETCNYINK